MWNNEKWKEREREIDQQAHRMVLYSTWMPFSPTQQQRKILTHNLCAKVQCNTICFSPLCRSKCEQTRSLKNNAKPVKRTKESKPKIWLEWRMKISCSIEREYLPSRWNEVEQHNDIAITSFNIPSGNVYCVACTAQYIGTISSTSWWNCDCCQRRANIRLPCSEFHLSVRFTSSFSFFRFVCLLSPSLFTRRSLITFNELPFSIINRLTIIIDYDFMWIIGAAHRN